MNHRIKLILMGLAIIVIVFLGIVFFMVNQEDDNNGLKLYGNVDVRQVNLGFRVFGKLKTLNFEEGDVVTKGDLLAQLDDAPYVQSVREIEGKVNSLKENLAYAEAQLSRRTSLVEGRSVSEEDYQQAYFNKKSIHAKLKEALAALRNARIRLNDTKLIAPSDGVIYTRVREPGTVLNVGEPVYSVALDTPVWVRTYVSEPELGLIYPGMRADVYTDTPESSVYEGQIGFISPIAEFTPKNVETPDLRTNLVYQFRVVIDHPDKGLRQGMPVTVKLKN